MSTPQVTLCQVDAMVARDILDGNRPNAGWHEEFPGKGDLAAMSMARFSTDTTEPWFGSYLILVDDVVSGTIGFKGPPRGNEVEVGYGVVPSQRGRGIATVALSQLLSLIAGHSLDVLAETDTENVASQSVLRHAGFVHVGRRIDANGGLMLWRRYVD